jgi:hypothetical protein
MFQGLLNIAANEGTEFEEIGTYTGAAGKGRSSPRSVGDRSIMLGGWPAYLSVRDDQLIAAVVNWAFLTSSECRLKQVDLVKGKDCVWR